jgi:hypothetical protein
MNKIPLIIWSRYRPAQLDLLLRSIHKNAFGLFLPIVIYRADERFKSGYNLVRDRHQDVSWVEELSGFKENTVQVLNGLNSDFVSCACDDNFIYRAISSNDICSILPRYDNEIASLRLGYNTIVQNIHTGSIQPPLNIVIDDGYSLVWPIYAYHPQENFGYPFSLDLHIFRLSFLKDLMSELEFENSSQLEGGLTRFRDKIDIMRSFAKSVAVNLAINSAGGCTRAGETFGVSLDELNDRFLGGDVIDLEDLSRQEYSGCHVERKILWSKAI